MEKTVQSIPSARQQDHIYRICTQCVMDTSDPDIIFDSEGVCNHCSDAERLRDEKPSDEEQRERLDHIITTIKNHGKHSPYDCILGLSGGADSSYMGYQAVKLGLRPLAVHCDNGWDSELAVRNIENLVKAFDLDLETYVINWEEFKDIQRSFLKASVIDPEMLTDHSAMTVLFNTAKKRKLRYILNGANLATEAVMPRSWNNPMKWDLKNIKAIKKRFGTMKLRTFPGLGLFGLLFYRYFYRVHHVYLLDYVNYSKIDAVKVLKEEIGWKEYPFKHYESIFTMFYQGYILPKKFGIDKRRAHYSALICSGQMTREKALTLLEKPPLPPEELETIKEYVLKKLDFSDTEFEEIMKQPVKNHADYPNSLTLMRGISKLKVLKKFIRAPEEKFQ